MLFYFFKNDSEYFIFITNLNYEVVLLPVFEPEPELELELKLMLKLKSFSTGHFFVIPKHIFFFPAHSFFLKSLKFDYEHVLIINIALSFRFNQ